MGWRSRASSPCRYPAESRRKRQRCTLDDRRRSRPVRILRHAATCAALSESAGTPPSRVTSDATTRTERAADAARDGTIGGFAGEVLARLRALGRRAPDALRPTLADGAAVPDLYYALSSGPLCVFCDATPPDATARAARDDLDDRGYRVLAIRADAALDAQLEHLP